VNNSACKWHVYILECEDKSLYVGATNDLERRLTEHKKGKGSKFVRSRKASKIIYSEEFSNKYEAFNREREIKGFSRQKKLKLIK
jgi:putative endonuclease